MNSFAIWPTLPLDVYFRPTSKWIPFPLNQPNCRTFSLARHAIWNACCSMGWGKKDIILVPSYHHGSEIEAILKAGLQIRYYDITANLEPDLEHLDSLVSNQVRALYLIHYLGFPQNASRWRQWCDERNLLLIEDAAQALLATHKGSPVGSFGDLSFFCLYKMYGIPDGGVVLSTHPPKPPERKPVIGAWKVLKRHFNFAAARNRTLGRLHNLVKPMIRKWNKTLNIFSGRLEAEFALGNPATPPTLLTSRLLPVLMNEHTAANRRANYNFLLSYLKPIVPKPFDLLPEGACPFAFPIIVNDSKSFQKKLHQQGVLGILFWLNPHSSLPVDNFPRSKVLREHVLALPVHQELTQSNLQQIVDVVLNILKAQQHHKLRGEKLKVFSEAGL